jgi:hypothetical protein
VGRARYLRPAGNGDGDGDGKGKRNGMMTGKGEICGFGLCSSFIPDGREGEVVKLLFSSSFFCLE